MVQADREKCTNPYVSRLSRSPLLLLFVLAIVLLVAPAIIILALRVLAIFPLILTRGPVVLNLRLRLGRRLGSRPLKPRPLHRLGRLLRLGLRLLLLRLLLHRR